MGSRVYDNDTSINNVTDGRIGVGDSGILLQDSSIVTTNNATDNSVTNIYDSDAETLRTISGDNKDNFRTLVDAQSKEAAELRATTARINSDSLGAVERASRAANDTVSGALKDTLSYTRGVTEDYLRYANQNTTAVANSVKDLGRLVGEQGDGNRALAEKLVGSVLAESRSSDEKNILAFLGTSKVIIGIVAAAAVLIVVAPRFAKG